LQSLRTSGDGQSSSESGIGRAGVQLSVNRKTGVYSFAALAGYTQVGEPSGVDYDNVVSYGIGVNRSFSRSNVFASLQGQTAAVPGATAPLDFDMVFFTCSQPTPWSSPTPSLV
jgi:hypothetical protein